MKTLINKIANAISGVVMFAAALALAGLGFAVVASLALFALIAVGVALLASPFIAPGEQTQDDAAAEPAAA